MVSTYILKLCLYALKTFSHSRKFCMLLYSVNFPGLRNFFTYLLKDNYSLSGLLEGILSRQ